MDELASFSHWLSTTPVSAALAGREWVVPAVQTVHILAIGALITSTAMLDLRLAGWAGRGLSIRDMAARFTPWFWGALTILALTGLVLILAEPARELLSLLFWTKMGLVTAVALVMYQLGRSLEDSAYEALPARKRVVMRTGAVASIILLLAIIWCGRWIGYTQ